MRAIAHICRAVNNVMRAISDIAHSITNVTRAINNIWRSISNILRTDCYYSVVTLFIVRRHAARRSRAYQGAVGRAMMVNSRSFEGWGQAVVGRDTPFSL